MWYHSKGEWQDDVRNGIGTYTYINGDTYEGEWSNNLRHGQGTYTFADSGAKYVGGWVNGRREGVGELIFANYKYKGNFSADQVLHAMATIVSIQIYTVFKNIAKKSIFSMIFTT